MRTRLHSDTGLKARSLTPLRPAKTDAGLKAQMRAPQEGERGGDECARCKRALTD